MERGIPGLADTRRLPKVLSKQIKGQSHGGHVCSLSLTFLHSLVRLYLDVDVSLLTIDPVSDEYLERSEAMQRVSDMVASALGPARISSLGRIMELALLR